MKLVGGGPVINGATPSIFYHYIFLVIIFFVKVNFVVVVIVVVVTVLFVAVIIIIIIINIFIIVIIMLINIIGPSLEKVLITLTSPKAMLRTERQKHKHTDIITYRLNW